MENVRLIDANALAERVKRYISVAGKDAIVKFIEDESTVTGWISVADKLPELIPCNAGTAYSEAVIVWTDNRKAMVAVWDGIDFLCAARYWEAEGEKITHWMPMPQPPMRDGDNYKVIGPMEPTEGTGDADEVRT